MAALPLVPWNAKTIPRGLSGTYEMTSKPSNAERCHWTVGVIAQPASRTAATTRAGRAARRDMPREPAEPEEVALGTVAQPERQMHRLHRLGEHAEQLAVQAVDVHLVAQMGGEALERERGVVLVPVEAPVDHPLDPSARGPEQGRDRERRSGDCEARVLSQRVDDQLQHEDGQQVGGAEQRGEPAVDERAVDDDVDVVEPVAQDRG